jgi:hypothetical protein
MGVGRDVRIAELRSFGTGKCLGNTWRSHHITGSVVHLNWNIAHRLHRIKDAFRGC